MECWTELAAGDFYKPAKNNEGSISQEPIAPGISPIRTGQAGPKKKVINESIFILVLFDKLMHLCDPFSVNARAKDNRFCELSKRESKYISTEQKMFMYTKFLQGIRIDFSVSVSSEEIYMYL